MNILILNRDFRLPDDGWYQIAPFGEFPHGGPSTGSGQAGIVQVIDREACDAMAARFAADAKIPNFAGLLVDFDHFSLDGEKRSEAAGWIVGLEARDEVSGVGFQVSGSEKMARPAGDALPRRKPEKTARPAGEDLTRRGRRAARQALRRRSGRVRHALPRREMAGRAPQQSAAHAAGQACGRSSAWSDGGEEAVKGGAQRGQAVFSE